MSGAAVASSGYGSRPLARAPDDLPRELGEELRRAARELALEGDVNLRPGSREALRWRAADLEHMLRPVGEDPLDLILVSLSTMIAQATPGVDGKLVLRLARHDILAAKIPEFALHAAAKDFRLGLAGDGRFRPTVAELLRLARLKALRFAEEAAQITRVLAAKTRRRIDPLEKARVAEGLRAYLREAEARAAERELEEGRRQAGRDERSLEEVLAEQARRGPIALDYATVAATQDAIAEAAKIEEALT